jgi:aminoglycoside phosphotransferase (APT) family kinase protein
MLGSVADSRRATCEEQELRLSVERALARATANGSPVVAIRRRGFPAPTSYAIEIVTVELEEGDVVEIFLKDFGQSRLPVQEPAKQRERELGVYTELLDGERLGTAQLYGACWDPAEGRFWLMLEFVDGKPLGDSGFDHWLEAAAWLGRLHGCFVPQQERLRASGFLERHNVEFFVHAAERALRALSGLDETLAQRLQAVLARHRAIVAVLARHPETLVHGSYRPQNLLVVRSPEGSPICPTDWELAGFGRRAYDLAFVCDGFRPPRLEALLDAYERGAESCGLPRGDRDELRHEVACFRLHKTINSLGHLRQWPRPAQTAAKVVATAEELAATLA